MDNPNTQFSKHKNGSPGDPISNGMKLLVITQKVDQNDPVLGFFHRWIEALAAKIELVTIICLEEGSHNLPHNVRVLSLGKEAKKSRRVYLLRFFSYVWKDRKKYDSVFVHMNEEYVLLAGLLWRVLSKKIILWRNHTNGTLLTKLAVFFSNKVLCTSKYSFTARYKKTRLMPVGIDTEHFKRYGGISRLPYTLLYVGRISPVKKIEIALDALEILKSEGKFSLRIFGDAGHRDKLYADSLAGKSGRAGLPIMFSPSITQERLPHVYNEHEILLNMTQTGSFDKVILEHMATEGVVIASNISYKEELPENLQQFLTFRESDAKELAEKIMYVANLTSQERTTIGKQLRDIVVGKHSLEALVDTLVTLL